MLGRPPRVDPPAHCLDEKIFPDGFSNPDVNAHLFLAVYRLARHQCFTEQIKRCFGYAYPLTQRVVVIDEDFAKHSDPLDPLMKTKVITRGKRQMTIMRWLNPKNEIKYEVYADSSHSSDQTFENGLKSVLRATALELTKDTATNESR